MKRIGFSTGSIAFGDFQKGIELLNQSTATAIELSALREGELPALVGALDELALDHFQYVSFHAPSKLNQISEQALVQYLEKVIEKGWPIVIHPDIIEDVTLWEKFGSYLCIENMDNRKNKGRTFEELNEIFAELPKASFCFDLAHVRQIDPTMQEGLRMIRNFSDRLTQLHVSDVNSEGKHEPLNLETLLAFKKIAPLIPQGIPVIIESVVAEEKIEKELELASYVIDYEKFTKHLFELDPETSYFIEAKNGDALMT